MHTSRLLHRLPFAMIALLASCGAQAVAGDASSRDAAGPHDPGAGSFAGHWVGTDVASIMIVQQGHDAGSTSTMSSSPIDVTISSASGDSMSITIASPTGGGSCTFVAERTGSTAVLPAGQSCSAGDGGLISAYTLQSGSASVNGTMLQIALVMTAMFTSGGTTANVTVSMSINATPG